MDFFVAFLALSEGTTRQLATLVGHKVAPVREYQVLEVQDLAGAQLTTGNRMGREKKGKERGAREGGKRKG